MKAFLMDRRIVVAAIVGAIVSVAIGSASLAKAPAKAAKKHAAKVQKDSPEKALFKSWFAKYFSMLYYIKNLNEARPYFSRRNVAVWDKMDAEKQDARAKDLKTFYIGNSVIKEYRINPGGTTADVAVTGNIDVGGGKIGNGTLVFHLVKEDNIWRIESMKGQATHEEKKDIMNPGG